MVEVVCDIPGVEIAALLDSHRDAVMRLAEGPGLGEWTRHNRLLPKWAPRWRPLLFPKALLLGGVYARETKKAQGSPTAATTLPRAIAICAGLSINASTRR